MKNKIFITCCSLVVSTSVFSLDFRPSMEDSNYYGVAVGYSFLDNPKSATHIKDFPLSLDASYGSRIRMNDRFFIGYEGQAAYLGHKSYEINNDEISFNSLQFAGLFKMSFYLNPYFDLHAKTGLGLQVNTLDNKQQFAIPAILSVGAGLYIAKTTQITIDIQSSIGTDGYPFNQFHPLHTSQIKVGFITYISE